jgi:hypothetical protein
VLCVTGLLFAARISFKYGRSFGESLGMFLCLAGVPLLISGLAGVMMPLPDFVGALFWPGLIVFITGVVILGFSSPKTENGVSPRGTKREL